MNFYDTFLYTFGACAGLAFFLLPYMMRAIQRRADRRRAALAAEEEARGAEASALLPVLMDAWRAIRWAKPHKRGLELLQLSECIQAARRGDARLTRDVVLTVLYKFPYEIIGKYARKVNNL